MSFRTQLGIIGSRRYFARRDWLDRASARARIARDIAAAKLKTSALSVNNSVPSV